MHTKLDKERRTTIILESSVLSQLEAFSLNRNIPSDIQYCKGVKIALQYSTLSLQLWQQYMWHSNIHAKKERLEIEVRADGSTTGKGSAGKTRRERERGR